MQQSHTRLALRLQTIRQFISRCVQNFRQLASLRPAWFRIAAAPRQIPFSTNESSRTNSAQIDPAEKPASPAGERSSTQSSPAVGPQDASLDPFIGLVDDSSPLPLRSQPPSRSHHLRSADRSSPQTQSKHATLDWVIPGKLAVGPLPRPSLAQTLNEHRIKVVLSVCKETEGRLPKAIRQGFRCLRVPLTDSRSSQALDPFDLGEAVDLIQWNLSKHKPVYVHCLAGMERSPTVCLAYLCRYQHFDLLDAIDWLRHVHPPTRITGSQISTVRHYLQRIEAPTPQTTAGITVAESES